MSLNVSNISFSYGDTEPVIFRDFSLEIKPEERIGLIAKSGFGKTTLAKIIAGYEKPDAGTITIDDEVLPKRGYCPVQMIWQHPEKSVNPRMRMSDILTEGDHVEERIIRELQIEDDWMSRYPGELSGGELQRFCIARALGAKTRYLIADEISTMLDLITQVQIWDFLIKETKKRKIGMLVFSHSDALLSHVCTKTMVLD